MQSVETSLISRSDGTPLAIYRSPGAAPGLLLVGGYGQQSPMDKTLGQLVFAYAKAHGQDCVALDFAGQGKSGGERWTMTIPGMQADIFAVADHLHLQGRIGIGASLGAWAMLAAQQVRPVLLRGMVALAPAFDWDRTYFAPRQADGRLQRLPNGKLAEPGAQFMIDERLLSTADACRLNPETLSLPTGLVVVHGADDDMADPAHAGRIVAAMAKHGRAEIAVIPQQDHNLSTLRDKAAQQQFVSACDRLLGRCGA